MDQLEELIRVSGYMKMLDQTNAKIIEALSRHDPRNIVAIAKSVDLPNSTVAFRIKKLMKKIDLEVNARVDFNKLGLARAFVFAEAFPGRWNTLWDALEDLGYLTYITKCYGRFYGCYSIFAFPADCKRKLKEYFDEAKRFKAISNFLFFWTTNLCEVHPNFDSYDFKKKRWIFQWEKLMEEIRNASDHLSEKLLDPKDYPIMADERDLVLLRHLEKNGVLTFKELAKTAKMSPRNVAYRYKKHLIERKLISDHMVWFLPYPYQISDICSFVIEFENEKALAKFANSLDDKVFILSYAKVLSKNTLITNTCLPKTEFPKFMGLLNCLAEAHLVRDFFHVALTLDPHKRGGVPYEFFKEGTWKCNIDKNIEKLRDMLEDTQTSRKFSL
ncbi:MAG TPA: winged helix-turn-helix transcriptional regulator [Candidatus Bathyarchaeia archaeon]|nr:winged helix-turn-helix transcriptional regulator [Candidatus Bathyarchaeia archaeon]